MVAMAIMIIIINKIPIEPTIMALRSSVDILFQRELLSVFIVSGEIVVNRKFGLRYLCRRIEEFVEVVVIFSEKL